MIELNILCDFTAILALGVKFIITLHTLWLQQSFPSLHSITMKVLWMKVSINVIIVIKSKSSWNMTYN